MQPHVAKQSKKSVIDVFWFHAMLLLAATLMIIKQSQLLFTTFTENLFKQALLHYLVCTLISHNVGRLGGSVGWASDFGSGHDLMVPGFEPYVGLCADSWEPGACIRFCVSLSISALSHLLSLSLSLKNK